jgi:L-serine dehydratase
MFLKDIKKLCKENDYIIGQLTMGQIVEIASQLELSVGDVIVAEAVIDTGKSKEDVLKDLLSVFDHNFSAIQIGMTEGSSLLMGTVGKELKESQSDKVLIDDKFINTALTYTLSAQVGNHSCGLKPCAGTGDSCVYSGLVKAMLEFYEEEQVAKAVAVMLKVGSLFRVGKTTTGCNMEGFGAGSAATSAGIVELMGGSPSQLEKAMVLSISPTIANPCTPRVMVAGLCATHIAGAIHIGNLSAQLAMKTELPVDVPVDVMMAMAAQVHPLSAKHIVPEVIKYMEPFFKKKAEVEELIDEEIQVFEKSRMENTLEEANKIAKGLAKEARSIVDPFGEPVVGGSSQAVGSPTNAGRIVHELASGQIKKIKVELYPELFARRGINIPGILMGAVFGASTADGDSYKEVLAKVKEKEIEIQIDEIDISQLQRITMETTEGKFMIDSLNRGGARLVIRDALPSLEAAEEAADKLGIDVVS